MKRLVLLTTLLLTLLSGLTLAAPPRAHAQTGTIDLIGQIGGATFAVFVQGNYAYIGVGPRLVILNITNPANPTKVGESPVLPDIVRGITVSGSYAYVVDGSSGLQVINVSNPAAPTLLGNYDTPGFAFDVAVSGSTAYVADGSSGLQIIDVSNPTSPTLVGSYDTPGAAQGVAVSGSTVYMADAGSGLQVINVSNPATAILLGNYDTSGYAFGVAVSGSYAYVADGGSGLQVINISNPTSLTLSGSYDTPGAAQGVAVSSSYAYVVDAWGGLQVINVSNPASPTLLGSYATPGPANGVAVSGSTVHMVNAGSGLQVINVSNPASPTLLGSYDNAPEAAFDVAVSGSYVYVADGWNGLHVINMSNSTAPTLLGNVDTPGFAYGVAVSGSYAYVADADGGLQVINVSNPAAPTLMGSYDTPGVAFDVAVSGSTAYVADGSSGLQIIDVSNPATPILLGSYDTPGGGKGVTVSGSTVYVADEASGLQVINVSNPAAAILLGNYDTPGDALGVVSGNYAYVVDNTSGLQVINVSNSNAPTLSGSVDTPGQAFGIAVSGSYAYVADAWGGLQVVNVSNLAAPTLLGSYDTPGQAFGVAVSGSMVYVANENGGLVVLWFFNEAAPTPTPTNTPTATTVPPTSTPTATTIPPTNTPTATTIPPTNTPTATIAPPTTTPTATTPPTPTNTPTPNTAPPDPYEIDNSCPEAKPIATDGTIQEHTFHAQADQDWLSFQVTQGITYLIQARALPNSRADILAELYGDCGQVVQPGQDPSFSGDVRYAFAFPASGTYHLRLRQADPTIFGNDVGYNVSIRALATKADAGALVIASGRFHSNPMRDLQANIQQVSNGVYALWRNKGYPAERIYYLSTNLTIDVNGDGENDVKAASSKDNLRQAIVNWTKDKGLGPERAFTLYLMDHGDLGGIFYLDEPFGERVTVEEVDRWLTEMETANPGVKVNVIIEACFSGGFIRKPNLNRQLNAMQTLGKANRVIIVSADALSLAYASPNGAWFSDAFLDGLSQNMSLAEAFDEGRRVAKQANLGQDAWLDGDGNGIPNQPSDMQAAAQRGFSFSGSLGDIEAETAWPPFIKMAEVGAVKDKEATIRATMVDNRTPPNSIQAWAVIIPPSYQIDKTSQTLVASLPATPLLYQGGEYRINYPQFSETGTYRVLIYAQDAEGLQSRPRELSVIVGGAKIYLPLIVK